MATYLYPHPNKRGVMVSRQRIYQLRRQKEGRCIYCGGTAPLVTSETCKSCRRKRNARRLRAYYRRKAVA